MSLYCGIDLCPTNKTLVVIDDDSQLLFQKRSLNDLSAVMAALKPFQQAFLQRISALSVPNAAW
jgi:hypothetical protein